METFARSQGGFAAAQDHLKGLGIPFRGPIDHRLAWSLYFSDLDGNPLEVTCAVANAGYPA